MKTHIRRKLNFTIESLGVDLTAVSKRLKALRIIQKQGNWVQLSTKVYRISYRE